MLFAPRCASASSFVVFALLFSGCSADIAEIGDSEEDLATKAFAYTCTTARAQILEEARSIDVAVSKGALRFADGYGPNLGQRDLTYRAPQNTSRVRFKGFEYGGDCSLSLLIDDAALRGAPNPQLRVQCAGDGFMQDFYTCGQAGPTRLSKPTAPVPSTPPVSTRTWSCSSPSGGILEKAVSLQVDDATMRLVADEMTYDGLRDRTYRPKTGNMIRYDGFQYGGDCSLSAVVEQKVLAGTASSATLKLRCTGDDFTQDIYACVPR